MRLGTTVLATIFNLERMRKPRSKTEDLGRGIDKDKLVEGGGQGDGKNSYPVPLPSTSFIESKMAAINCTA